VAVGVCRLEDLDTCRVSSPREDHSVAKCLIQMRNHAPFVGTIVYGEFQIFSDDVMLRLVFYFLGPEFPGSIL